MINKYHVFSVLLATSVVGCSSSTYQVLQNPSVQGSSNSSLQSQMLVAEDSNHISQSLYLLQFERASGLHEQANQLALLTQQCTASEVNLASQWQLTASHYMALQAQQKGPQLALDQSWTSNPWTSLDETQWLQESFSLVNNQLDFMLKKLALPLGTIGKPKPYFAEAWRSQLSYSNLYSNLVAIEQTLQVNNGLLDKLSEVDPKLHQLVVDSLKESVEQWPKEQQLFTELSTKEGYRNALSTYNRLEYLNYLVSEQAAQTLGVRVGFNATDGD